MNKRSIIMMLICLEMILLGINVIFINKGLYSLDMKYFVYIVLILAIGGCEGGLGLGISYKISKKRGSILLY